MIRFIILPLLLSFASACTKPAGKGKEPNSDGGNGSQGASSPKPDEANATERVDIPSNIAGSYLTCAIRKEGSASDPSMEIGCLLREKDSDKKVNSDEISWSSNRSASEVAIVTQGKDDLYNVLFRMRESDLKTLNEKAQALETIVSYRNAVLRQEKVYNVLKPAIVLKDFNAPIVREQSIEEDGDGSL